MKFGVGSRNGLRSYQRGGRVTVVVRARPRREATKAKRLLVHRFSVRLGTNVVAERLAALCGTTFYPEDLEWIAEEEGDLCEVCSRRTPGRAPESGQAEHLLSTKKYEQDAGEFFRKLDYVADQLAEVDGHVTKLAEMVEALSRQQRDRS